MAFCADSSNSWNPVLMSNSSSGPSQRKTIDSVRTAGMSIIRIMTQKLRMKALTWVVRLLLFASVLAYTVNPHLSFAAPFNNFNYDG